MAQDIRKMMRQHKEEQPKLDKNHVVRFEERLVKELGEQTKKAPLPWLKIAVAAVLIVGLGFFTITGLDSNTNSAIEVADVPATTTVLEKQMTLADISPDFKKHETFYNSGINVLLASLDYSDENQELIDGYMQRLGDLDKEYKQLNAEFNEVGPTEGMAAALIDNLKLRLELLINLNNKLKELKNQNDDQFNSIQS